MADPNVTLIGCSGTKYRFGPVPFARHLRILGLDKAVLRANGASEILGKVGPLTVDVHKTSVEVAAMYNNLPGLGCSAATTAACFAFTGPAGLRCSIAAAAVCYGLNVELNVNFPDPRAQAGSYTLGVTAYFSTDIGATYSGEWEFYFFQNGEYGFSGGPFWSGYDTGRRN